MKTAVERGQELRRRRIELGLTQHALADMIGVTSVTIYLWEHGGVSPRLDTWERLMALLGELEGRDATVHA